MRAFFGDPVLCGIKTFDKVMKCLVLGIAGGTGSGKTTVARSIVERIGADRIAYLEHDAYCGIWHI